MEWFAIFYFCPSPPRRGGEGLKYRNHKTIFRSRLVRFEGIFSCLQIGCKHTSRPLWGVCDTSLEPSWQKKLIHGKKSHFARTARPQRAKTCSAYYISYPKTTVLRLKMTVLRLGPLKWVNCLGKRTFSMKKISLCVHGTPVTRENVFHSLHKPPQNDCFETWIIKIS